MAYLKKPGNPVGYLGLESGWHSFVELLGPGRASSKPEEGSRDASARITRNFSHIGREEG